MLRLMQKLMRTSREVMVLESGIKKGKEFWSFIHRYT